MLVCECVVLCGRVVYVYDRACDYEKGADGLMLHTLTSPDVVTYELVPDDWTVSSLLLRIATAKRPQFHALIDTGALVTGRNDVDI